jgi:hypothetical protein
VGTGVGMMGMIVAAAEVEVVDLQAFEFKLFEIFCKLAFFRQLQAIWPWVLQGKHHPSAQYLAHSSSVSLWNRVVILAESTSIGTCWLFEELEWVCCLPIWYTCGSHGWFQCGPITVLCNSLIWPTSFHTASFHLSIVVMDCLRSGLT